MEVLFGDAFKESVKQHSAIKEAIKKKVDMIIENPIAFGEPLKGNFRGYFSCPVRKNFLIIYLYCRTCRKRGDNSIVQCSDCNDYPDETVKFVDLGPHDKAYGKK